MAKEKDKKDDQYQSIKLEIVTKDGNIVFSENIAMVNFPGESGVFTILPGHTPFFSTLRVGTLKYKMKEEDEKYQFASVIGGFCEANPDYINVITNACEPVQKIDIKRAEESKKRAEQRIKNHDETFDSARAEASLARAIARISTVSFFNQQQQN
ncbi:ATP synthase F1 subunit epsilon [Candidatus Dependentiae bacterium]|nr:ATP synthase F1 subunit epsilon [Candidatus Dependentiae bacterium]